MGAGKPMPAPGGKVDEGKRAILDAMARYRAQDMANNPVSRMRRDSPEGGFGMPAGYRPGLEPDYQNMEEQSQQRDLANRSNVESANPIPNLDMVRGGISFGPGRATRVSDEDARAMVSRMRGRPLVR
jgi:hypothetical protein